MSSRDLLQAFHREGISVSLEGDSLRVRAPKDAAVEPLRRQLAANKAEIIEILSERQAASPLKGCAVRYFVELFGEEIWLVADEEDAGLLDEPRGRIYTLAEIRTLFSAGAYRRAREIHAWKRRLNASLRALKRLDKEDVR